MPGEWPLVGRVEELALLRDALADPGSAGAVLVGEAGVGKTRLAAELTAGVRSEGHPTRWVSATRSAAAVPLGAVADLLPADGESSSRAELFARTAAVLCRDAVGGRVVVGVDDAHLLDDASAGLVHHLARCGGVFLVVTVTSSNPVPDAIRALWKDGLAVRVDVQALSLNEVAALLALRLDGPVEQTSTHRLWSLCQGNVLFLRELVAAGLADGRLARRDDLWCWRGSLSTNARLVELVEARIARLGPDLRSTLEILAVGEPVGTGMIAALEIGLEVAELDRRGVLRSEQVSGSVVLRLAHPLHAQVVRAALSPRRRAEITAVLADALTLVGAVGTDVVRLATWQLDSGRGTDPDTLVAGANAALATFDPVVAERLARAAVRAGGGGAATVALATALASAGRHDQAVALFEGLDLSRGATDADIAAAGAAWSHSLFYELHRPGDAEDLLRRLEPAVACGPSRDRMAALRATLCFWSGRPTEAAAIAAEVVDRATPGTKASLTAVGALVPALVDLGRTIDARALADRHLALALADPTVAEQAGAVALGLGFALWLGGRLVELDEFCAATVGLSRDLGVLSGIGCFGTLAGVAALARGRVRTAVVRLHDAAAALADADPANLSVWCWATTARACSASGDAAGAVEAVAKAESRFGAGAGLFADELALGRAWAAAARGELSTARAIAVEAADLLAERGHHGELFALHDAARLGAPALVADRIAALAVTTDGEFAPAAAAHARALADGDASALDGAAAMLAGMGAELVAAEAAAAAASLHQRAGRRGRAAISAECGATWARSCEGAVTPGLARGCEPSLLRSLTDREHEIAGLAAAGLTNRQIASSLVLSTRTVGNHLYRLYAKLGVADRAELTALIAAVGPALANTE
ncbi:MAG: helix-turn-helix transcriptional regulator [Acidimicrobiales bacterium]